MRVVVSRDISNLMQLLFAFLRFNFKLPSGKTEYTCLDSDIAEYVNASFETNPLDGKCDQRIKLTVQPLEVIYHAVSAKRFRSSEGMESRVWPFTNPTQLVCKYWRQGGTRPSSR